MNDKAGMGYFAVWVWLVVLLIVSVLAVRLPFPQGLTTTLIFLVAAAKAVLIGVYYMHLRAESALIRAIAIVPVVLFAIMLVSLIPDIVVNSSG